MPLSSAIIYNGTCGNPSGSTPFAFYDNDLVFQQDTPKIVNFIAKRLGYPTTQIEIDTGSMFTCIEEAITTYGNEIYMFKIRDNYLTLEGTATGSALNNTVIGTNLGSVIRIAEDYGSEAGVGGYINIFTGSINFSAGVQNYDLNAWAHASASISASDSIEIKRIFYEGTPAMVRYYDPYAGTGLQPLMDSFGFGGMSPGVQFTLMPVYADIQRVQAIEFNDQVRRSAFSFELVNNQLKTFPIPTVNMDGLPLFFTYIKVSDRNSPTRAPFSGSNLVTNISNVPYQNPIWNQINGPGRQWVFQYSLALVKQTLAYNRGKYNTVPIPDAEVTLNQQTLLDTARTEIDNLISKLRDDLQATSRNAQLAQKAQEAQSINQTLVNVPLPIYIG